MSTKMVFPGEEIAKEEEYESSTGTYIKNGKIYASVFGELILDDDECTATIVTPNPVNQLQIDDVVYAVIEDTRKSMASATALCSANTDRTISSSTVGTIHVSKITPKFQSDVSNEFRKGDLIRARVIDVYPSLQLSTKEDHMGVIRQFCSSCKTKLEPKKDGLVCPKCNKFSSRKLADDYGDVKI